MTDNRMMTQRRMTQRRKLASAVAAGLLVAAPLGAFFAAPAAAKNAAAPPGSGLSGINADATGSAAQLEVLVPGLLPLGNAAKGDLVNVSMPYATSTVGTGPTTSGTAAPAWPGTALANAGSLAETFSASFPTSLANLLNDHVAAYSTFPAQLNVKRTGKFAPPGGAGESTSTSGPGSTYSHSVLNDTVPLGPSSPLAAVTKLLPIGKSSSTPLIEVGSATTSTSGILHANSVRTSAQTKIGVVTVAGLIKINGVNSDATTTSNGTAGHQSSHVHVGAVTVAGVPASIGPNGLTLDKKAIGSLNLVPVANSVLEALKVAGITIRTIAPSSSIRGSAASVTSGALSIAFQDNDVPNLGALLPQLPLLLPNSLGVQVNLGTSQADADATPLPSVGDIGGTTPSTSNTTTPPGTGTNVGPSGGSVVPGGGITGSTLPPVSTSTAPQQESSPQLAGAADDEAFGLPVRVAWIVGAFVLALLAAGPLLAYANWQLLRGRSS